MKQISDRSRTLIGKLGDPRLWIVVACIAILLPLILYAYMGIFSRYQADDYCLAWNGTARSFLRAQTIWYRTDSSRFSATMLFTLSDKIGRWTVQALPALELSLWLAGCFWLIHRVQKKLKLALPACVSFLMAEVLIYFVLLLTPNLYQVLYWRSGSVVYFFPIVLLTFLLIFLLAQASKTSNWRYLAAPFAIVFSFFIGGFSETIATIQVGMAGLAIVSLIAIRKTINRKWAIFLVSCALVGSLLAMAMMFYSPATRMRQGLVGAAPGLFDLVRMSLSFAFQFMYITLGDKAFQLVILMLTAMLVGYTWYSMRGNSSTLKVTSLVSTLFITPFITYLLIVSVCAPFAYGESTYPEARVLLNATVFMVIMVMVEGLILGISLGLLHQRSSEGLPVGLKTVSLLLLIMVCLFPLYSIRKVVKELPVFEQRAEAWDKRDLELRTLAAQGKKNITVTGFDSYAGLLEISPTPTNWVNGCAALYYGVRTITATSP